MLYDQFNTVFTWNILLQNDIWNHRSFQHYENKEYSKKEMISKILQIN